MTSFKEIDTQEHAACLTIIHCCKCTWSHLCHTFLSNGNNCVTPPGIEMLV